MQILRWFLAFMFVSTVAITSAMVSLMKPIQAEEGDRFTNRVPMKLDCENLKGSALEYARVHNLCPSVNEIYERIGPADVREGDCGWSSLFIQNLGTGLAAFHMAADSRLGPIVNASYNVSWLNWSTGGYGNVSGSDWLFASAWKKDRVDYTGLGTVSATMNGSVLLAWGGTCTFRYPSDTEYITQ